MCFGKRLMTKYIPKKVDNKNDKINHTYIRELKSKWKKLRTIKIN